MKSKFNALQLFYLTPVHHLLVADSILHVISSSNIKENHPSLHEFKNTFSRPVK